VALFQSTKSKKKKTLRTTQHWVRRVASGPQGVTIYARLATTVECGTVGEEVPDTTVFGSANPTDDIVTTAINAILGAAYVTVYVVMSATNGVNLRTVHTTGQ